MVDKCPKCGDQMEKGLMLSPGAVVGVRWMKEGEISRWFGAGLLAKKPRIMAYSCKKCGFVESYVEKK